MATKVDILVEDGFHVGTNFTIQHTQKDVNGDPQDISGWAMEYTLRKRVKDTTALITKTVGNGITIVDGAAGRVDIVFVPSDTEDIRPGVYAHKLTRTDVGAVGSMIPGRGEPGAAVFLLAQA